MSLVAHEMIWQLNVYGSTIVPEVEYWSYPPEYVEQYKLSKVNYQWNASSMAISWLGVCSLIQTAAPVMNIPYLWGYDFIRLSIVCVLHPGPRTHEPGNSWDNFTELCKCNTSWAHSTINNYILYNKHLIISLQRLVVYSGLLVLHCLPAHFREPGRPPRWLVEQSLHLQLLSC